ncbi:MAG: transposase [Steroidobacteraceae bacterium]
MRYRRAHAAGGTWFFTVNLADRSNQFLTEYIGLLRETIRAVRINHPFEILAAVVLPEHLHCIWRLPNGDADYPIRWNLIKGRFSRDLTINEQIRDSRLTKRERGIWQRRYWEHQIRDDEDLQRHVDYIHHNPVKHGRTSIASAWPYSSIHRYIRNGMLTKDWATGEIANSNQFGER